MHFRVRFEFKGNINNEIDMSIWRFLPGMTKITSLYGSGCIWFETDKDWSLDDLKHEFTKAIDAVFEHYKEQGCFGYVEAGYQDYLDDKGKVFSLSAFCPPDEKVNTIKGLKQKIQQTEVELYGMRFAYGELLKAID